MAWIRLDDRLPRHPKILEVGPKATWLLVCCVAYCRSQKPPTEFISDLSLRAIGAGVDARALPQLAQKLVDIGLITRTDGGYQVPDPNRLYTD